ncbi:SGNH/GDSL hydrolase family protein, partial [Acidobacteriota bacterium]
LKGSIIVFGMSILLILLMESFLRIFYPQNLKGRKIIGASFSNENDLIGLKYSPGSKWEFSHPEYKVIYEINEYGFRDKKHHPIPKPEGITRILLLGDSFTFGQGVSYEQTWPVLIESWLESNGNSHIDIVKAASQGLDTRSEYILMKRLVDFFDCNIVVIVFLINDLYTNSFQGIDDTDFASLATTSGRIVLRDYNIQDKETQQSFIRNKQRSIFHSLNLAKRLAISNDNLFCKLYLLSIRAEYLTFPLEEIPKKNLKITESLFNKIASYCHSIDKKLIVLSLPQQFQYLYLKNSLNIPHIDVNFYDSHFYDIAVQNDFIWINTLDHFNNLNTDEKLFYRLDGHFSPEGSKVVAEIFMKNILPLVH